MRLILPSALSVVASCIGNAAGDSYANNQNAVVVDSPQVSANFPDVEGVQLLSPAFLSNATLPSTWANGTSGPTPQSTLESFVKSIASRNGWINYHDELNSEEGRSIPYVTLSNGKHSDKKLRLWLQGGQHGDEPAGDQGALALLAKFANDAQWASKVLEKIDLLILPRYNADGVEYFQRQLASNYDPNRDHAVLLREQTRAIRQAQSDFDPHIFIDAHEYTGVGPVAQRYIRAQDLLVSANKNPNVNANIRTLNQDFVEDIFVATTAKGLRVGPYFTTSVANGTITIQEPDWHAQANHKGAGNYQALTFLVETRGIRLAAQHFQRRVASQLITLTTIIDKAVSEFESVYATINSGREAFTESNDDLVVLDDYQITSKQIPFFEKDSGKLVNVTVRSQNSDPTRILLTRPRPRAYIFSRAFAPVAERLHILGVNVTQLSADYIGTVEALVIETAEVAEAKFEGIAQTSVTTRTSTRQVKIPKGGFWVDTRQKNAGYAFALLEPEGVGSVVRYNIVPGEEGDEYPIFRVI
ncbi:hypothetical protein HBI68_201710 [Parastagonospora nodorum]|nr:hypothetical protein HBH43_201860 [Parastagonospora nodorum]KAH5710686.1 hypothetical protein HBI20_177170 [Parastagonospora nodorum]KAH6146234.1 hypothetical protein HBI68_201710 [Parastagonospora nodorum]